MMDKMAQGNYWGAPVSAETGENKNGTPLIEITLSIMHKDDGAGGWTPIEPTVSRKMTLYLSQGAWPYSEKKLAALGFNGDFGAPAFECKGLALACVHKAWKSDPTKFSEEWDLPYTGGAGAAPASEQTLQLLNARYRQEHGYQEQPPAPAAQTPPRTAQRAGNAVADTLPSAGGGIPQNHPSQPVGAPKAFSVDEPALDPYASGGEEIPF